MTRRDEHVGDGDPVTPPGISPISESLEKIELPYVTIDALNSDRSPLLDAETETDKTSSSSSTDSPPAEEDSTIDSTVDGEGVDQRETPGTKSKQFAKLAKAKEKIKKITQKPRAECFSWTLRGWGRSKLHLFSQQWRKSLQFRTAG